MIDPTYTLTYSEDRYEQECVVLYNIAVAGKSSESAVSALGRLLFYLGSPERPLEVIHAMNDDQLREILVLARFSPYGVRFDALKGASKFCNRDLRTVTVDEWRKVRGIGQKTARYIRSLLVEGERHAILDTHILKWLKSLGYPYIPKSTPQSDLAYDRIERYFLDEADKRGRGQDVAAFDLEIWSAYKTKGFYDG